MTDKSNLGPNEDATDTAPRDAAGVPPDDRDVVPPPPIVSGDTKWTTLSLQGRHWLNYSKGRGEDRYFISKGSRRAIESFPMTDEGWIEAWHRYAQLEPKASRVYAEEMRQRRERELSGRVVTLGYKALFMGGLPGYPGGASGSLWLSKTAIGLGERVLIPLEDVASIEIADGTVSKSKVGATLAFGVLGATGSRGTKTEVSVVAHLKSGATGYFLIPDSKEGRLSVRAKAGPILHQLGIPFTDQLPVPETAPIDIADQLRKLKELRDEGVLSTEEFEKAKAKLLD
jgi:Short C-terminal domain